MGIIFTRRAGPFMTRNSTRRWDLSPIITPMRFPWANPKGDMAQALEKAFKPRQPQLSLRPWKCFNVGFHLRGAFWVAADGFKRAGNRQTAPN